MTSSKAGVGVLLPLLLSLLLLALSNSARAFNTAYSDLSYWEQWALTQGYTISNYVYSEGNSTGSDGEIGNEFVCIRDDVNQVIIGRPDVCGMYYSGLGYSYADITTDPTSLTTAPDIIDSVTGDLIDHNLANWGGCNYTANDYLGGTNPGGPRPNCGENVINFSYSGYWVYRRHAIEQALKQAGVNVDGYTWQFRLKNNNGDRADQQGIDSFTARMLIWDNSGNIVHSKDWSYTFKFNWTTFSGTELFNNPLIGQDLQSWQLQFYGRDSGFWSGFYGPEVDMSNTEINMIYSQNPCAIDPLLHPDCAGFVDAYANYLYDQNCIANPLYDSGCPGYQQAYYNQQCNANPLYDQGCPGYAQAYYDQQCSFNPLYDSGCPGYAQAYYDQQCSIDPLYDTGCPGYAQAYLDQQCGLNTLYDQTCPGYAEAYYNQQCGLDPLYDRACPGYGEAYAKEFVLNEETTSPAETVSTASQEIAAIADPVQALTETPVTGDATIDSILGDLNEVPIATFSVEAEPVAAVETQAETQETSQETEASTEADSTTEELVADVKTEAESSDESESTEESDGSDNESSDESEGKDSNGRDSKSEKKDSKREKMKKAIAAKAANLANEMAAAATLEAQQAAQAQVLALINYVPDFNTYNRMMNGGYMPDAAGYPDSIVPESRRGLRNGLAQQLLHEKMVEMQYENSTR